MKKIPWGILAGTCAILVFYLSLGVIVSFNILNSIAGQTHTSATLFDSWWQTLLFVMDIVFAVGLAGTLSMFVLKKTKRKGIAVKEGGSDR